MIPHPHLDHVLLIAILGVASASAAPGPVDLYSDNCASCHGADGKARTPAGRKIGAKDLTKSTLPDEELIQQITNGKKDARGVEKMPAFKEKLSTSDIAALAGYIKTLRQ